MPVAPSVPAWPVASDALNHLPQKHSIRGWHTECESARIDSKGGSLMALATKALVPVGGGGAVALHPGTLGNLDAYITAVNRIPLLSAEEEVSLAHRFRTDNDLEAAVKLV